MYLSKSSKALLLLKNCEILYQLNVEIEEWDGIMIKTNKTFAFEER